MVHLQMEQLLIDCLLPGMSMVPALTALANEVWGAVNLLDCTDRWRIYTAWRVLPSHIAYKVGDSHQAMCGIPAVHACSRQPFHVRMMHTCVWRQRQQP